MYQKEKWLQIIFLGSLLDFFFRFSTRGNPEYRTESQDAKSMFYDAVFRSGTSTCIVIGRSNFCKLVTSNSTVNLLYGIVNKRPLLRHQNTLILGSRKTVWY